MRLAFLPVLLAVAACGDPGPRDRSLAIQLPDATLNTPRHGKSVRRSTSVIGLVNDPLAQHYAEEASLIVRFEDVTSLARAVAPRLKEIARVLPQLGLPSGTPNELLHRALGLPDSVTFDPLRPFAFVLTKRGWVGIVPARVGDESGPRLRALDAMYSVAGDPKVVAAYEPGFRKGFHLPGDCSVVADPASVNTIGTAVTRALEPLGLDLRFLDGKLARIPADIERVDLAVRFGEEGMRFDIRLAPRRDSPAEFFFRRLKPGPSSAVNWMPPGGAMYVELGTGARVWEELFPRLFGGNARAANEPVPPETHALRRSLRFLNNESAVLLQLDPEGCGHIALVSKIDDAAATRAFLDSVEFRDLLKLVAGSGGHLEWMPGVFEHRGGKVGAVTGHISRDRLARWRESGVLCSALGTLLRGPVMAYVAVSGNKLCIVAGKNSRAAVEGVLERLVAEKPARNGHSDEVDPLFRTRLASASIDLARLFDGSREAAPYWHPRGRALRSVTLGWRIPAVAAITVEGGALRLAVRLPPRMLANAAARITQALDDK